MYLILYSFFFLFLELGWLNHNLFIYKYNMKRLLKNGYLMFFGCIVLNGNALHAVVLFRNTKSKKKEEKKFCCLISTSWLCVYWPRLSYWARSLSFSLSSCLLCLFFSFMWCCGSWLHSIQCNLSNPPCCDVVNKLQVNWFWFVTIFFFFFFFLLH